MFFLYLLTGVFAGLLSGLLGVGGGVVVVPALIFILSHSGVSSNSLFHVAAGTSLAIMVVTASASAIVHAKQGNVVGSVVKTLLPGLVAGVIFGAVFSNILPSHWLKTCFGLFLLLVAVRMFLLVRPKAGRELPRGKSLTAFGGVIGFVSGMLGIGAGSVSIPFLNYHNVPMRQATGISAASTAVIAFVGAISVMFTGAHSTHLAHSTGYIYWPAFWGVSLASVFAAPIAAKFSIYVRTAWLKRLFAVFLLLVCINLLFG